jgi:hypothetical protein
MGFAASKEIFWKEDAASQMDARPSGVLFLYTMTHL